MRSARTLACLVGVVALVAAACGDDDSDASTTGGAAEGSSTERTVDLDMVDNAFEPDTLDVDAGETVHFVFTNTGAAQHDAFIGDAAAQAEHESEMRSAEEEGSGEGHDMGSEDRAAESTDDDAHGGMASEEGTTVEPGETGELTYTFDEPGTLEIGCHEPGHYDAGMKVTVTVS